MPVILADSFTSALARLTNDEQKQAKLTAFDLQTQPDSPSLRFHRIDKSKDPNFWSVRVNRDLRIIVHKDGASIMLVHVGHHDDAYGWAERRRIEAHPKTGAIQIVEVRELVEEIAAAGGDTDGLVQSDLPLEPEDARAAGTVIFAGLSNDDFLSVGVPEDWLADVAGATEDGFFSLAAHLPPEAAEALLEYAATGVLVPAAAPVADPLEHPDTMRRFRLLDGAEELAAALDAPFEKWIVFLHPAQRGVVKKRYSGPARVVGSAGTGKSVVALHRVMHLALMNPRAKILLTTFSEPLARELERKLRILCGDRPGVFDRVAIESFEEIAEDLFELATGRKPYVASDEAVRSVLAKASEEAGAGRFSEQFLYSEWIYVVDAWQIESAGAYAEVPRMGRKNRLGARQRKALWQVFERARQSLSSRSLLTRAELFAAATRFYGEGADKPFAHIVVDEAQDLGVAELRLFAAIAPSGPDALFFAGDLGQRIFQQPFSWKGLGVDVRGRSSTLRVNYRTTHQIRRLADRLLPKSVCDVDGLEDERAGTVSVFDGPAPEVIVADTAEHEKAAAAAFLRQAVADGIAPDEIGAFVRSHDEMSRARDAIAHASLEPRTPSEGERGAVGRVFLATMHLAKGLEFRAVVVMACDEGVLPLDNRIADVADEFELDEVIATERQLLYVAATRARDRLFISGVEPASEFLDDLRPEG